MLCKLQGLFVDYSSRVFLIGVLVEGGLLGWTHRRDVREVFFLRDHLDVVVIVDLHGADRLTTPHLLLLDLGVFLYDHYLLRLLWLRLQVRGNVRVDEAQRTGPLRFYMRFDIQQLLLRYLLTSPLTTITLNHLLHTQVLLQLRVIQRWLPRIRTFLPSD